MILLVNPSSSGPHPSPLEHRREQRRRQRERGESQGTIGLPTASFIRLPGSPQSGSLHPLPRQRLRPRTGSSQGCSIMHIRAWTRVSVTVSSPLHTLGFQGPQVVTRTDKGEVFRVRAYASGSEPLHCEASAPGYYPIQDEEAPRTPRRYTLALGW